MNVLSIIDKIYESSRFSQFLTAAIIILIILFCIVLILGIKDSKKSKKKKEEPVEEVKDITFDMPTELESIKEDVTFEMPSLTQNLENFKKNLEEEIQKEDMAEVRKTSGLILPKEKKPVKVLDLDKIEDTAIIPIKEEQNNLEELALEEEVNDAIEDFFSHTEEKKNVLEETIFSKNKDYEIPIIKEGVSTSSSSIEVPIVKELDSKKEEKIEKKDRPKNKPIPPENKKTSHKTIVVSGIGGSNVIKKEEPKKEEPENKNTPLEKRVENPQKRVQKEQTGIYSTEDDF